MSSPNNPDTDYPPPPREVVAVFTSLGGELIPETSSDWARFGWDDTPEGPLYVIYVGTGSAPRIQVFREMKSLLREFPLTEWHLAALFVLSIIRGECE
jgi:hypothetical protein